MEHRGIHGRHALEHRHGVALHDRERLAGVEPWDQRQRPADRDGGVQRARLPEGVEERQRTQGHGPLVESDQVDHDLDVAQDVLVRELGALRLAGRAGGVEDHGRVVGPTVEHLVGGLTPLQQSLELAGLH